MQPDKQEQTWALRFATLVMLATTLPYIVGYQVQGKDWRFTGFVFGVEDGNSYIAKMLSGASGEWLFRTPYTTFEQRGILAFLPYILLGKLASPPGMYEQLIGLYHLFCIGAGILAILATHDFLALFLTDTSWRRFGLLLATLGGGMGWLLVISGRSEWLGSLPLEFYSPESFGFLSLFGLPHLALVRALLLWGLVAYLRGSAWAGFIWLLLGLVQPLYVMIVWAVIACYLLLLAYQRMQSAQNDRAGWQVWRTSLGRGGYALALSSPPVVYTLIASLKDPFFKAWTAQNLILSPHPLHYLLAYGLMGLVIMANLPAIQKWLLESEVGSQRLICVAWIILLPFLVYMPYPLQRRMAEGVWVALVCLACGGLAGSLHRRWRGFLLLLLPSTFLLWSGGLFSALRPALPLFRPSAETAAFEFIASNVPAGSVVLASYETGNALPAWAPVRVIIGHGPESIGLTELKPRLARFYDAETPEAERRAFLSEFGVSHVFWGPAERALGEWNPQSASYLKRVYAQKGYSVFLVNETR